MYKITEQEMKTILDALNIAGAQDAKYDELFDILVDRKGDAE